MNTKKIAIIAVMSAISVILAISLHFPTFLPFLEYDPADIPIILCTYLLGPSVGIIMTLIVSILQGTLASSSGIIGILMHFIATGSFVLMSGILFKQLNKTKLKSIYNILISTLCGIVVWIITMIAWNILLTPIFMGIPREAVYEIILPAILPFNIVKPTINASIACVLYFTLRNTVERYTTIPTKLDEFTDIIYHDGLNEDKNISKIVDTTTAISSELSSEYVNHTQQGITDSNDKISTKDAATNSLDSQDVDTNLTLVDAETNDTL